MKVYQTPLTAQQEAMFQASPEAQMDTPDYDMRGAWLEMQQGLLNRSANGHYPDKYKTPYHPTFSTDSTVYNGQDGYYGGQWFALMPDQPIRFLGHSIPENFVGSYLYMVNPTNTFAPPELQEYWNRVEPGNVLWDTGVRW